MKTTIAAAVVALFVASCGSADEPLIFTDTDTGSEILLATGDHVEIRLESNATTGYRWLVDAGSQVDCLEFEEETYVAPNTGLVGAPGYQVFSFEADESGAGILRLEYVRPWEDPAIPERLVEFVVRVDGALWPPEDRGTPPGTSTASVPEDS